jgi:hypothetical protein
MSDVPASPPQKLYHAIISTDPGRPAQRVTVLAEDVSTARRLLEETYGEGTVFNLHNPEEAAKPRGE